MDASAVWYVLDAVCFVYTCRRSIDLSNDCRYKAAADNAGSASAVCLLTAQSLRKSLGGNIPVGAVNSCVGGSDLHLH